MVFRPKVEILPAAQRELWPLLSEVPQDFVLYGGTAVALWFGHRTSVDFDFFSTTKDLFVSKTTDKLSFVKKFKVVKGCRDDEHHGSQVNYGLKMPQGSVVNLSFIRHEKLIAGSFMAPSIACDTKIKVASPFDLMAAKINALKERRSAKDFIDISTLIENGVSLNMGFAAAMILKQEAIHEEIQSYKDIAEKITYPEFIESVFEKDLYVMEEEKNMLNFVIKNITLEAKKIDIDKLRLISLKTTAKLTHEE